MAGFGLSLSYQLDPEFQDSLPPFRTSLLREEALR